MDQERTLSPCNGNGRIASTLLHKANAVPLVVDFRALFPALQDLVDEAVPGLVAGSLGGCWEWLGKS